MQREQRARRERRTVGGVKQLPWRTYRNPYKPIEVLTEEQLERIHDASMRILEEFGIEFLDDAGARAARSPRARSWCPARSACASTATWSRSMSAKAPSEFTLHARVAGAQPDLRRQPHQFRLGRLGAERLRSRQRTAARATSRTTATCCGWRRACNVVQFIGGYPVEPADMPPLTRHLDAHYAAITLTDRIWHPYSLGARAHPRCGGDDLHRARHQQGAAGAASRACSRSSTATRRCASTCRCCRA